MLNAVVIICGLLLPNIKNRLSRNCSAETGKGPTDPLWSCCTYGTCCTASWSQPFIQALPYTPTPTGLIRKGFSLSESNKEFRDCFLQIILRIVCRICKVSAVKYKLPICLTAQGVNTFSMNFYFCLANKYILSQIVQVVLFLISF